MQHPILVPLDLSEGASGVLAFAGEVAGGQRRPLLLLHVVNWMATDAAVREDAVETHPSRPIIERARDRLQAIADDVAQRHPALEALRDVRTVLVSGVPASRILEVAEREEVSMIVMGSHGRTGMPRLLAGSVAEAVARGSRVPVTIVKKANGRIASPAG